jgi:hypothetical protein
LDFLLALLHRLGLFCGTRSLGECALSFAVERKKEAEVFSQVPECVDRDVAGEVGGVCWSGNFQDQLTASVELAQKRFAVE